MKLENAPVTVPEKCPLPISTDVYVKINRPVVYLTLAYNELPQTRASCKVEFAKATPVTDRDEERPGRTDVTRRDLDMTDGTDDRDRVRRREMY